MMKKSLVLVSLLFLAALSIARAESPNISTDQINKQDSFLLVQNDNRDTRLTDLLINKFNPPIAKAKCGGPCSSDSDCKHMEYCYSCTKNQCQGSYPQ